MLSNTLKKARKESEFDLIVVGNSLSAYVAVHAACVNNLQVAWLNKHLDHLSGNGRVGANGFDSLAPEGVRYLSYLLDDETIDEITLGTLNGIYRGEQFQEFDPEIGVGIQFYSQHLKYLLLEKSKFDVTLIDEEAWNYEQRDSLVAITTDRDKTFFARWIINAQGKDSPLSKQAIQYLSEAIWITRCLDGRMSNYSNTVRFEQNDDSWSWLACDAKGFLCKTQWHTSPITSSSINSSPVMGINHVQAYNSRWYRRASYVESLSDLGPCVLLTAPTCYRFDASSGLGSTLQIKSALLAVRCITLNIDLVDIKGEDTKSIAAQTNVNIQQYQYQMESSFEEIFDALKLFYQQYGLDFSLADKAFSSENKIYNKG